MKKYGIWIATLLISGLGLLMLPDQAEAQRRGGRGGGSHGGSHGGSSWSGGSWSGSHSGSHWDGGHSSWYGGIGLGGAYFGYGRPYGSWGDGYGYGYNRGYYSPGWWGGNYYSDVSPYYSEPYYGYSEPYYGDSSYSYQSAYPRTINSSNRNSRWEPSRLTSSLQRRTRKSGSTA